MPWKGKRGNFCKARDSGRVRWITVDEGMAREPSVEQSTRKEVEKGEAFDLLQLSSGL